MDQVYKALYVALTIKLKDTPICVMQYYRSLAASFAHILKVRLALLRLIKN